MYKRGNQIKRKKFPIKFYKIIFIIILSFLVLFLVDTAYNNGKFDTLNHQEMIQAETAIHNRMWDLSNGINGAVRSKYAIQDTDHWLEESDKLLSDIDAEIKNAKTARVHDSMLKDKYISVLKAERESVAQTRQGIVDTTQGMTYENGFQKGTEADLEYDRLHNDFIKNYTK